MWTTKNCMYTKAEKPESLTVHSPKVQLRFHSNSNETGAEAFGRIIFFKFLLEFLESLSLVGFFGFVFGFGERRKGGRKHQYERETSVCCLERETSISGLSYIPPQPRQLPWSRIEPVTFPFAGRCPTNWAIPVRHWRIVWTVNHWPSDPQWIRIGRQSSNSSDEEISGS